MSFTKQTNYFIILLRRIKYYGFQFVTISIAGDFCIFFIRGNFKKKLGFVS